ncbi:MAG: hypothetical protein MG2_1624, partial [uncultured Candidatus Poseidoniales archaeon]
QEWSPNLKFRLESKFFIDSSGKPPQQFTIDKRWFVHCSHWVPAWLEGICLLFLFLALLRSLSIQWNALS